jgi:hypothetical protein
MNQRAYLYGEVAGVVELQNGLVGHLPLKLGQDWPAIDRAWPELDLRGETPPPAPDLLGLCVVADLEQDGLAVGGIPVHHWRENDLQERQGVVRGGATAAYGRGIDIISPDTVCVDRYGAEESASCQASQCCFKGFLEWCIAAVQKVHQQHVLLHTLTLSFSPGSSTPSEGSHEK